MTVQFISSKKELAEVKDVLGTITVFEMFIFGGLGKNPKGDAIKSRSYNVSTLSWDEEVYPIDGFCHPDWIKKNGKPQSPLGGLWSVINAVNAVLMMRATHGSVLPEGWVEAFKQGGYFTKDGSTVPAFKSWLIFWGHKETKRYSPAGNWFCETDPERLLSDQDENFEGKRVKESDLLDYWWLPASAPFAEFFQQVATVKNKDNGALTLYDTVEVQWTPERVYFPGFRREGRFRYTWKSWEGDSYNWVKGDSECLGNVLFWWTIGEVPLRDISRLLNRDSTSLVSPNRVYGQPSPLNRASDRDTVGHIKLRLGNPGKTGPCLPEVFNDESPYAAAEAARFAFEEGLPVLFQHQLESLRVGEVAAGLGKSTIKMLLPVLKDGVEKLTKVRFSLGQFLVDKATKLFNRDSLELRCQPIVHADLNADLTAEEHEQGDALMKELDSLVDL